MTEENTGNGSSIPKLPLGALGAAAALALAGAVYAISSRNGEVDESAPKAKSGGGIRKRLGLMTAIAVIENDATRKLLLTALKAMAKRA